MATHFRTESDSVFLAHDAAAVTAQMIANWDEAHGYGDHAGAGYLTSETSHADVLVDGDIGVGVAAYSHTHNVLDAASVLKLNSGAGGDVTLFSSADRLDTDDGRRLIVWRNAPERNDYIRLYISKGQVGYLQPSSDFFLKGPGYVKIESGNHTYLDLGDNAGAKKVRIRDSDKNDVATIDSDGKAVFAETLITERLSVVGSESSGAYNATIEIENTAVGGDRWFLRVGSDGTFTPTGGFSIADSTAYRLAIDKNGNVGIGTMSPTKKLDVNGGALIGGNLDVNGTVDGRDVAADGTKLDTVEDDAEIATKEFFIPAGAAILSSNASYDTPNNTFQLSLADAVTFARCFFVFALPTDFSSMVSGYPKVVFKQGTGGTGNYRIAFNGRAGGVGEQMGGSTDSITEYTMTAPGQGDELWEEDVSACFDGLSLAAGDYVGLQIQRDSDDSLDTFSGDLDVVGIALRYTK